MLSKIVFTMALAASSTMAVALPKDVQAVVATDANLYNLVSPDGTCGGKTSYTCAGSVYGDCCSTNGLCGATAAFCAPASCFAPAGVCSADFNRPASAAVVTKPTRLPWKPTPHHDPYFKPSYKIDNGERAPNQVWS